MNKLIKLIKAGTQKQIICFHFAGGSAEYFTPWQKMIDNNIALYAIQLPGRGQRIKEPFVTCIHENAEIINNALQALPKRPTYFFGHSMGATLAFETALRWENEGNKLEHLMVSGRIAPSIKKITDYHQQDDQTLIGRLKDLAGTSPRVFDTPELRELFLPIIRADFETIETYQRRCRRVLSCPISAFRGISDNDISPSEMNAWKNVTKGNFAYHEFDGDHFYVNHRYPHFFELLHKKMT